MPYPTPAGTNLAVSKVKVISSENSVRKVIASIKWQPGELGRIQRVTPSIRLFRSNEGYLTPSFGSSGPVVPTSGQIWPRGNN